MDIKAEPHFTLTITLTDDEAKAIIVDPDSFLAQLQDSIAPNGDYAKRAAQSDSAYRRGSKRAYKGHRKLAQKKTLRPVRPGHCRGLVRAPRGEA